MGSEQIFKVLTEFRFDVAHAVASSKTLQGEIGKISDAADGAHFALQRMGMGLVAQMGLGTGGVIGALYAAVQAADKFQQSQRQIANIFLSSNMFDGATAFDDAMSSAAFSMNEMKKVAREFSLPTSDMVQTTKLIGASLVNHGLDDNTLHNSIQLSRGFLKSAPTLGIDPGMAQGELLDIVNGRAGMHQRLFQRLTNETAAMRGYGGASGQGSKMNAGSQAFNALDPAKRLDVLTKSLMQFGSNARVVSENAMSLSSQMQRMRDNITGVFSVLKPIGDAILRPLKKIMFKMNQFLEGDGEKLAKIVGKVFNDLLKDPEKLFIQLQSLRRLKGDLKKAGDMVMLTGIIHGVTWALNALGIELNGGLLMTGVRLLGGWLKTAGAYLLELLGITSVFSGFMFVLKAIRYVMIDVLAPLMAWLFFFRIISDSIAKAKLINLKWLADHLVILSDTFNRFREAMARILAPLSMAIDFWSDIGAWLLANTFLYDATLAFFQGLVSVLEMLAEVIILTLGAINGMVAALFQMIDNIRTMQNPTNGMAKAFDDGVDEMVSKYYKRSLGIDDNSVSQKSVTVNGGIHINNDLKENADADRIAFTLKDQILKVATNPQEAANRSMKRGLVGN